MEWYITQWVIIRSSSVSKTLCSKSLYEDFHSFYTNLLKLFGNGYILQKQDLFFRKKYHHVCDNTDFLDNEYFKLFEGREYTETET